MRTWHYRRIKFRPVATPFQAPAGNWVFLHVCVRNSDKASPFRQTHYAIETLGM